MKNIIRFYIENKDIKCSINKKEYQNIVLTETPELYDNNITCISKDELSIPKTNISVGTAILAYDLKKFNYNIPLAITAYNYGITNVYKVLKETSNHTGLTIDELINDPSNTEFLKYRDIIDIGDPLYFEHVTQYIINQEDGITAFDHENNLIYKLNIDYQLETVKTR